MATAVETATTFDTLTKKYIEPGLHDQVFSGTPVLDDMRDNIKFRSGKEVQTNIQTDSNTVNWYDPDTDIDLSIDWSTPDIAEEINYGWAYAYESIRLPAHQVDGQGGEAIADLLKTYTDNARDSMGSALYSALWAVSGSGPGDHAATQITSMWDLANDESDVYGQKEIGDIDTSSVTLFNSMVMEEGDNSAVSPSLANIKAMIMRIQHETGKRPDACYVHEDYWHVLAAQLESQVIRNASNRYTDWGYETFEVLGVPVVYDPGVPGQAFTGGANRYAAGGYEAVFWNWDIAYPVANEKWNLKFHPNGWQMPTQKIPQYVNTLNLWMNFVCKERRALGHIYNVDLDQDVSNWAKGTITVPS